MTDAPIKYAPPPAFCGQCFDTLLDNAAAHPEQNIVSVYCGHGRAVITAQIAEHEGERKIWCWSISGPLSAHQAVYALHNSAAMIGATPVMARDD